MTAEGAFPKLSGDGLYPSEVNTQQGSILKVIAGENISAGNVIYIKKSDGKAYISDTGTADDIRADGVAAGTKTTGQTITIHLNGKYVTSGLTANTAYYLAAAGAISTTSSGVLVGHALNATSLNVNIHQDDRDLIGAMKSYAKSFTGVPANNLTAFWVEANGQVLSDGESPLDGETIPDLNGDNRFMRGNSTSGATAGTSTHFHTGGTGAGNLTKGVSIYTTDVINHLPPYYNVVWIMKIK